MKAKKKKGHLRQKRRLADMDCSNLMFKHTKGIYHHGLRKTKMDEETFIEVMTAMDEYSGVYK